MQLNKLSYRMIEGDNKYGTKLLFELLIDEKPICGDLAESGDSAIPYYEFENNDLSHYWSEYENADLYTIAVCVCGNSGCGSETCQIDKDEDYVVFRHFSAGCSPLANTEFKFSRQNYDLVIKEIVERTGEYKRINESN